MTIYRGRYELVQQVARGGTAQVFLAKDLLLDRSVALKILFPELSTDPSFVERFRKEARAAANLSHQNIVPVFDYDDADNTYLIVMEFVDGEALSSIIRTQAPLPQDQAASIGADIAKALGYAHRHGVVHRDVKPGNVLITADGQVKVTDFGIARAIGSDEQVTQTGLVMGTATYFSPEQAQGLEVDGRSDIYSLGVVLYEMATGRPPFAGENPVSIAYQHVRELPPTPRSLNPGISPAFEAIITQAMAKTPAERYQTADELRADLDRFVRGQTVLARPPSEFQSVTGAETAVLTQTGSDHGAAPAGRRRDELTRRSTTPIWITAAVVLLLGIVAAVVITGRDLGYFGGAKFFKVPDVEKMQKTAATQALTNAGLKYSITPKKATGASDANTVLSQSPAFPTPVRRGDIIHLDVAGAAPLATIPANLVNEPFNKAESTLKHLGFVVVPKSIQGTPSERDKVQSVQPAPGTRQVVGTTVTLTYVVGVKQVSVPTCVASATPPFVSQAQAGACLENAQLSVGTNQSQISATVPNGDVISSNPAPGSQTSAGTQVILIVSEGPGITVPAPTQGQTLGAYEQTLTQAGLQPEVVDVPTANAFIVGEVQTWSINPNNRKKTQKPVAPGTAIYVWTYTASNGNSGNSGTSTTTTTIPVSTTSSTIATTTTVPIVGPPVG